MLHSHWNLISLILQLNIEGSDRMNHNTVEKNLKTSVELHQNIRHAEKCCVISYMWWKFEYTACFKYFHLEQFRYSLSWDGILPPRSQCWSKTYIGTTPLGASYCEDYSSVPEQRPEKTACPCERANLRRRSGQRYWRQSPRNLSRDTKKKELVVVGLFTTPPTLIMRWHFYLC